MGGSNDQVSPAMMVRGWKRDDHVVRLAQKLQPLARQGEGRERPLADDHRMDELDRDVVGIRPVLRRASEGEQPPSAEELLGHHAACTRERLRVVLEVRLARAGA